MCRRFRPCRVSTRRRVSSAPAPAIGSSSSSSLGAWASAIASSSRRFSPCDRAPAGVCARGARSTARRASTGGRVERLLGCRRLPEAEAGARARLHRQRDVLQGREAGQDLRDLERPGEAEAGAGRHRQPGHVVAVEEDAAGIGGEGAGDLVDEGGLAGAVGADDGVGLAGQDGEVDAGGHPEGAERLLRCCRPGSARLIGASRGSSGRALRRCRVGDSASSLSSRGRRIRCQNRAQRPSPAARLRSAVPASDLSRRCTAPSDASARAERAAAPRAARAANPSRRGAGPCSHCRQRAPMPVAAARARADRSAGFPRQMPGSEHGCLRTALERGQQLRRRHAALAPGLDGAGDAALGEQHHQHQQRTQDRLPVLGEARQRLLQHERRRGRRAPGRRRVPVPPSSTITISSPERCQCM